MKIGIDYVGVCVVYLCHDGQGNFVMNKRGKACRDEVGKWDIGGGKLELHENIEDRLRSEIKEEYGAEVLEYERLGFTDVHRIHEDQKTHWISLDYKVLVNKDQVHNAEPHKLDEVKWFRWNEILADEKLHSALPGWFEKYEDKLK